MYVSDGYYPVMEVSFRRIWEEAKTCQLKDRYFYDAEKDDFTETRIMHDFKTNFRHFCEKNKGFVEKLYNAEELTWEVVRFSYRVGLMNMLDWQYMYPKADDYIEGIIENETHDTDEWIELVETIKDLKIERNVIGNYFYNKLDEDLKYEIGRFSAQGECDEEWVKLEFLKEMLPMWTWYGVSESIEEAEKRIKEEEEEEGDAEPFFDSWQVKAEREDAEIEEMFEALRYN